MRCSSCVSLSSLRNASSISDLPATFFTTISENRSTRAGLSAIEDELTQFSLFNLLGHKGKDEEHLNHDVHDYTRHFLRWGEIYVDLKSSEHILYPFEDVQECVLVSAYALNRLGM